MVMIDGSQGEGGGQILRSALALAACSGTPVRIQHIRARRPKPGLQRQHLAAVLAATQVCAGQVDGAELGSREITFTPGKPQAGVYEVDIGSAGSAMLVLQTVLPILLSAQGPSAVTIRGGTHNSMAPPVEFLQESWLPVMHGLGVDVEIALVRHGFQPAGGGVIRARIAPGHAQRPLVLLDRGKSLGRQAEVLVANLPDHVGIREAEALKHALRWSPDEIGVRQVDADGPGNAVMVRLRYAALTSVFTAFGAIRTSSEQVAAEAARQVRRYVQAEVPVCDHLADQLLLPLALGVGGRFRTGAPTEHTRTNAAVIAAFLGPVVSFAQDGDSTVISVAGRS